MPKKLPILLSQSDEFVPETYIPISDIFSYSKYALPGYSESEWCLGKKALKKMREETFKEVKKRFEISGAKSFSKFWNGNLDAINSIGINEFSKLSCFAELCTAMICFEERKKNTTNENKRIFISFGIKRDIYAAYYKSLKNSLKNGSVPDKVNLFDYHKRKNNDVFQEPRGTISITDENGSKHSISIPKNEVFYRFERWCMIKRIKKSQAIYNAMNLLMEANPVEGLDGVKAFVRDTGLKSREVVLNIANNTDSKILISIPGEILNDMESIIYRYNSDPENKGKNQLTKSIYAAQAISAYNKRIPLKYSDPIAYKAYIEIKQSEMYNETVSSVDVNKHVK